MGGNLPWNTASAMVRPTTAAMAKIRMVIHMVLLPFYTSHGLCVTHSAAAACLQGALQAKRPLPRWRTTADPPDRVSSVREPVVSGQNRAQLLVRQCAHVMPIDARHVLGGHHGVDDGFLGRLHGRGKQRVHGIVRHHLQLDHMVDVACGGVRRRERDEDVARSVAGDAAGAADAERYPSRNALELVRQERRVGRHDHDDRSVLGRIGRYPGIGVLALDLPPDRDARDAQVLPPPVVALHQHADEVAAVLFGEPAGGGADAALETVADHAGSAADRPLLDRPRVRRVERVQRVLRPHVHAVAWTTTSVAMRESGVVWPTSTRSMSVIAFSGPGAPSKGTPRSRARARSLGAFVRGSGAGARGARGASASRAIILGRTRYLRLTCRERLDNCCEWAQRSPGSGDAPDGIEAPLRVAESLSLRPLSSPERGTRR